IHMHHHMPSPALYKVDHAMEHRHIGSAAEMLHEIEAHPAHATTIEHFEILVGKPVIDDRNTSITLRIGGDAIEHCGVVGPVTARLHDHRSLYTEMRMQRSQHFLRRVGRRVPPVRSIGKLLCRPKYMAMGIATARQQLEMRFATAGKKVRLDIHEVALAKRSG